MLIISYAVNNNFLPRQRALFVSQGAYIGAHACAAAPCVPHTRLLGSHTYFLDFGLWSTFIEPGHERLHLECVCVYYCRTYYKAVHGGGRRRVEDMCYERRRAEACVDAVERNGTKTSPATPWRSCGWVTVGAITRALQARWGHMRCNTRGLRLTEMCRGELFLEKDTRYWSRH